MNGFNDYLKSLPKPLNKEEQLALINKYIQTKDAKARDLLIQHNLRLATNYVLKHFKDTPFEDEDLVQIATIGLVNAVESYSPNHNTDFSTYATICIRNYVYYNLKLAQKETTVKNNTISFDHEVKIDTSIEDHKASKLVEFFEDEDESHIQEDYIKKDELKKIQAHIKKQFGEQELFIFNNHFGFTSCGKPLTNSEIAEKLNMTHQNVSRIKNIVLDSIKTTFYDIKVKPKKKKSKKVEPSEQNS